MPVWELVPVDPQDLNWAASRYNGRLVIRADSEARARCVAFDTFRIANETSGLVAPWKLTASVDAREIDDVDGPEEILEPALYEADRKQQYG